MRTGSKTGSSSYFYSTTETPRAGSNIQPITGRVDRALATETVDLSSIPGWIKSKTIKIDIQSFPV